MSSAARDSVKGVWRGGAESAGSGDYSQRKDKNRAIKLRIAQQCARLVKPGGTIFIDTGTTNLAMAEALPTELALTVVTNSPEIAAVLVKKPLYDVVILGGGYSARAAVASAPRRWLRCRACYSTKGLSAAARWRQSRA